MRIQIIKCLLMLLLFPIATIAQQSNKVTQTFFQDPIAINTPLFQKRHGFTSYKEMNAFLAELQLSYPNLLKIESIGKTQRGRTISMVKVSKDGSENKLRILYLGRVHGNEPSGTEALLYFLRQLLEDEDVGSLLDKADFYIIPMVNIDGAKNNNRPTANGVDLNRDQSALITPEAKILQATAHKIQPHLVVDFHEYQPVRNDFAKLSSNILSIPWDVMFLYSSNPNVHPALRNLVQDKFIANASSALDKNKITYHTYYSSADDYGHVYLNVGGASPRSTSNLFALKNSVSMLMEIRGQGLNRISMKRRVYTGYLLALSFANTAISNEKQVLEAIKESEGNQDDIAVKFSAHRTVMPFTFVDMINNQKVVLDVPARLSTNIKVTLSRPMPKAYYILSSQTRAIETLRNMGIEVKEIDQNTTIHADSYTVTSRRELAVAIGGSVYPVDVTTQIKEGTVDLPAGTYCVKTNQPYSRLIGAMLEPESSNGFVNYGVIQSELNKELPVYREK